MTRTSEPSSYIGWADYLKRARDGYSRPLSSNKRVHWAGSDRGYGADIAIQLHATDVVTLHADGSYSIAANGWQTVTTKQCISRFSPARVYSERGTWYVEVERDYAADPEPPCSWRPSVAEPFAAEPAEGEVAEHDCGLARAERYPGEYRYCAQCSRHDYAVSRYREYREHIDQHGSWSQWQDAYKEARKVHLAERRAWLAWNRRNRIEFFDGVRVGSNGYVPRGEFLKLQRAEARAEKAREVANRKAERLRARIARETAKRQKAVARELGLAEVELVSPDVVDWLAQGAVEVDGKAGTAILCKAVNADYESDHGALYVPGCATLAADYDPAPTCGRGLHFSPSAREAEGYAARARDREGGVLTLACAVPLASLVPIGGDKAKALSCKVLGPWTGR